MSDHLLGDVVLKLAILNTASVSDYMKRHRFCASDLLHNVGKMLADVVMIGRHIERPRQGLEARVAVRDRMQRADAGMGL